MKNSIIINESNAQKIKVALDNVQKRCSVRLVQPEQVFEAVAKMEEYRKNNGITKKSMEGVTVKVNLYQERYPSAYKYTPEGTVFHMIYRGGKWRLYAVYRDICEGSENKRYQVNLTDDAKNDVLKHASVF